jgi:hypothetical protein
MDVGSSRAKNAFQKPYSSTLVQDHKDEGFGDLLSRSLVHANSRDGETIVATQ